MRYAITDRRLYPGDESVRRAALVRQAARLAGEGLEFLQLREKDLPLEELSSLATEMLTAIRNAGGTTRLLVNGSVEAAVRAGADGVHLPAAMATERVPQGLLVSVSCHSLGELERAITLGANVALFGPVFGKSVAGEEVLPGIGLGRLREACAVAAGRLSVVALGGVTEQNAAECIAAGAAGVAGIRMFLR